MENDSPGPARHNSEARLAGALATGICLTGLWVVDGLTTSVQFPPTALAEAIIRAVPGDVSTFFIDLLKHWALRLLAVGVVIAALAFGAEAILRTRRADGTPRPWVAALLLASLSAAAIVLGPRNQEDPAALIFVLGAAAMLYATAGRRMYELLTEEGAALPARRRALRLGIGGALGLVALGGVAGWFAKRFGGPDTDVPLVTPEVRATEPARGSFPNVAGLSPEVTSADDHYVVDINLVPPSIEADDWDLRVEGLVDAPLTLTFTSLQRGFPIVEEHSVLTCISNEVGGGLVGNSVWGGVRLRDLLSEAGVREGAVDVVFRAEDGYSDSIPLEVAMDPSVLVAVSQNGRPLTQEHGFPCRVRVPMIYGMKNVKWLRQVEVVDHDYQGYWMERGWSDEAVVRTQSRIDVAGVDRSARRGEPTWIAGVAWAGGRGIAKVEVSTDGGRSWEEAMLHPPISRFAWTQWAYRWTPKGEGGVVVVCRATDDMGDTQTAELARPHPAGATGYHRVEVDVT
jgi:DMSO/TMAO reductase YedYZ molybdopterin-dependent catalytic subunit